ncbi:glycerophosphoryl diester phosphodiesterase [Burkholderiales bacterium]|nr:glycerophosphoryl diester phosphodiesterase [Burkholderiales bacterium]
MVARPRPPIARASRPAPGRACAGRLSRHALVAVAAGALAAIAHGAGGFDLQGHRGARGLAPENTLAGFAKALDIGVTTLETDLAVTRDGVVVISHDPDLNPALVRGSNGFWLDRRGPAIRSLTLAELRAYDIGRVDPSTPYGKQWPLQLARDGERFPTLAEVFALARSHGSPVRYNLETKITPTSGETVADPETFVRAALAEIRAAGVADRTTLQSFDWRTVAVAKRLAPEIATACLTAQFPSFDTVKPDASGRSPWHAGLDPAAHGHSVPRLAKAAGCEVWSANAAALTAERVREAHSLGLKVLAWTVNDRADMARAIDLGVDGIITDYPDRARDLLRERGIALP